MINISKKILLLIIFAFVSLTANEVDAQCGRALTDVIVTGIGDAKYLKDYRVRFEEEGNPKKPPEEEFSILLNKGTHYRFSIKKDSAVSDEPVLKLFDFTKPYGSNYDSDDGSTYDAFDFFCAKTQVYYLAISFAKASPGCISVVVSYVGNY